MEAVKFICRISVTAYTSPKLKLYWSIIRPIITYACETWVLKETIKKNKLIVFERKVFRKIFDPTKERDATWRIKTNGELYELRRHKNTINHIKTQILSWFGHLQRMPEDTIKKTFTIGNRG